MASRTSTRAQATGDDTSAVPVSDRRQDILDAALACFAASGLEALSIDLVRQRCGASVGSIYHHFGSKEGIIAALFFDILQEQSRSLQSRLDASHDVRSGVQALVLGYLDWVVAHPQRARFLFQARAVVAGGPRAPELAEHARRRNESLLAWLGPRQRTGELAAVPCELMPSLVLGPAQSSCRAWLSGNTGLPSPTQYREALATAAWKAVAG